MLLKMFLPTLFLLFTFFMLHSLKTWTYVPLQLKLNSNSMKQALTALCFFPKLLFII